MTESSEKRYNDRKVVENIMINSIEKTIELPIEQKHTGKGNPNAVFGIELNNRQKDLLEKLSEFDSKVIVDKKSVNMADLVLINQSLLLHNSIRLTTVRRIKLCIANANS